MSTHFRDIDAVMAYFGDKENRERSPIKSKPVSATRLSGGLMNYVYRLKLEDGGSIILKVFEDHMAGNSENKLPKMRYFIEKNALDALSKQECFNESIIRTPKLFGFDDSLFALFMEDCGENLVCASEILKNDFHLPNTAHLGDEEREQALLNFLDQFARAVRSFDAKLKFETNIRRDTHDLMSDNF